MPQPLRNATENLLAPVHDASPQGTDVLKDEIALCLSGGGYRAMLFHTGVIWRLHDLGLLGKVGRISSVSGGSIIAGLLALKWKKLFPPFAVPSSYHDEIVVPIRRLAEVNIDIASVGMGALLPGTISSYVANAYAKHLFGEATLQELPDDPPRFVINATNVQSGALWRFSKPYMRDYLVGEVRNPKVRIADAVAASSAFPPFLSPASLPLETLTFEPSTGEPLHHPPFTTEVCLTDGGVYDNLGLETAWKRCKTLLVSDAGQKMSAEESPDSDWARHSKRILDLVDNQVRSLRKRQLIAAYQSGLRTGAYWSIRDDIAKHGVVGLPCPYTQTEKLAEIPTRLSDTDDQTQQKLINWGYGLCDSALRTFYDKTLPVAHEFPFDAVGV